MKLRSHIAGLAAFALLAALATAEAAPLSKNDAKAAATIKQNLEARFPEARIVSVQPSSRMPGFYEVFTGDTVSYSDATGDHVFVGSFIDTKNKRNLTSERVDELNAIDFNSLPFDRAIKTVKGNGSRKIAVFADPECPYCQQLEKELAQVTDVTIYTFLFPIPSLHPDAPARARAVWCAADRGTAWKEWMVDHKAPESKTCAGDPVDELTALGEKLRINSTPTLFALTGKRFAGSMEAAALEKFLDGKSLNANASDASSKPTPTASRN